MAVSGTQSVPFSGGEVHKPFGSSWREAARGGIGCNEPWIVQSLVLEDSLQMGRNKNSL